MWLVGVVAFCVLVLGGIGAAIFLKSVFDPVAKEFGWWK